MYGQIGLAESVTMVNVQNFRTFTIVPTSNFVNELIPIRARRQS